MDWILTTVPAVSTLVFLFLFIVIAGVVCYVLYRFLLQPMVEQGETHPANLRRGLWCFFLILVAIAYLGMLWSVLTLVGKIIPPVIIVILSVILLLSFRRS